MPDSSPAPRLSAPWLALVLALCAMVWVANSSGILSSNDGSHLALGRALGLRGTPDIGPDRALTLEVDMAERDGRAYSDRPPGTAMAALPAVRLGHRLDPAARDLAVEQARSGEAVDPLPGPELYLLTYAQRSPKGPALVGLIATSIAINLHAALVGLLGLLFLARLLGRLGIAADAQVFAILTVGLATLWGPYSTALFAHGSAACAISAFLLGALCLRAEHAEPPDPPASRSRTVGLGTGLAGAWAVACDYLLLLAVVPVAALVIPWRRWPAVLLGTAPIVLATLAYHRAAFGHPLAIGYDFQTNFAFARERGSTFSGSLGEGLWTTWGLGRGAGMLAQSPVSLAGLAALTACVLAPRWRFPQARAVGLAALSFLPWVLAVALHRTPWGGGTEDHRYLVPLLPLAALGLALAWSRAGTLARGGLVALAALSCALAWRHFLGWHEALPFARPRLGLAAACVVALVVLGSDRLAAFVAQRRRSPG